MTFDEFKYHQWDVLITYVSAYYPLSHSIIEQFKFDLNWRSISSNSEIEWTPEFIEEYKDSLVWHLLVENSGIPITEEFVKRYKKRLDWYYLAHNPSLPITDSFLLACGKDFKVAESNPNLTLSFKEAHLDKIVQRKQTLPKPEGLENCSLDNFNANWPKWKHNLYPEIYRRIIEPNLSDDSIVTLLNASIPQPGKFVYFSPAQKDEFGLITSFETNPKNAIDSILKGDQVNYVEFTQGTLQEGKDRIYDIVNISSQRYPCLLVSRPTLAYLQHYNLPEVRIVRAELKTKKLNINQEYFLLIFEDNTLVEECESHTEFEFYFKKFSESGQKRLINGKKESFDELKVEAVNKYKESISDIIHFYPKFVDIKSKRDLFTFNRKLIISKRLREGLIHAGFGPCDFLSTIPMVLTTEVSMDSVLTGQKSVPKDISIAEDDFYVQKQQRLEEGVPPFSRIDISEDRMTAVERKLNVIFPKEFRGHYLNTQITFDDGMISEEFDWLPLEKIFIENSYAERYPETFKCCVVAENGGGDYIGLLLEKHDDYKLNPELVMLKHETGEMVKGKLQIT